MKWSHSVTQKVKHLPSSWLEEEDAENFQRYQDLKDLIQRLWSGYFEDLLWLIQCVGRHRLYSISLYLTFFYSTTTTRIHLFHLMDER